MSNTPTWTAPDRARASVQRTAVWEFIKSGDWFTLKEIHDAIDHPEASISARLRDFRKVKYGGHNIHRRRRNGEGTGTWEYRLGIF